MKDKITKRTSIRFSIIERINYYFSDPLKKHNNSIESVKETEKQSKEAANLSGFQSSYKGDNSPPTEKGASTALFLGGGDSGITAPAPGTQVTGAGCASFAQKAKPGGERSSKINRNEERI